MLLHECLALSGTDAGFRRSQILFRSEGIHEFRTEQVTVYADKFTVEFKSGMTVDVDG